MATKPQHEVCGCHLVGLLLDKEEQELKLLHEPHGSPPKEDLESSASTDFGNHALESEAGEEDSEVDHATFALPFSVNETLVIFDWDDTLLPTTWLERESVIPQSANESLCRDWQHGLTMEQQWQLRALAESAARTLAMAKEHGILVIVTNAVEGWVQNSCMQYFPAIAPLLEGVKIVSARSSYEPLGHSPDMWKCLAFQELINNVYGTIFPDQQRNVLSIGDSKREHKALLYATKGIMKCRAKFLKFSARPDVDHLAKQHAWLRNFFQWAIHHDDDLDLEITMEFHR